MSYLDTPHGKQKMCAGCGVVTFNDDDYKHVLGEDFCNFWEGTKAPCYDVLLQDQAELTLADRAAMQEFKRR